MNVISDTGILQDLARVMIQDCRYDVSWMLFMDHLVDITIIDRVWVGIVEA